MDYSPARAGFLCPCHNSTFRVDGTIDGRRSPSPRGLDALAVEIRAADEVWVKFQNFQPGIPDKVPA